MYPDLFKIFGFTVHSYGVLLLIAFFVGVWFARKRAPRFGFTPTEIYDGSFWALILGVIGARVFYIIQEWDYYSRNTSQIFSWQFAGLTSFGAIAFGLLGYYIWTRLAHRSFVRLLDLIAPPFLVAHAIGRVGCLLNGCCYGGPAHVPWAIHVSERAGLYHPAQIYDSLMNLVGVGVLLLAERKGISYGKSTSLGMIAHGTARFIYEFWRAGTTSTTIGHSWMTDGQAAALVLVACGVLLLFYLPHRFAVRQRVAALEV
jgi:phosphatidylglycerol:prolipoprotein diacylglycerol transferase